MWRCSALALMCSLLMTSPVLAVVIDDLTLPGGMTQFSAPGGGSILSLTAPNAARSRQLFGRAPDPGNGAPGALHVDGSPAAQIVGRLLSQDSASILYDFGEDRFDFHANDTILLTSFRRTGGDAEQALIRVLVDGAQVGTAEWEGVMAPGIQLISAPIDGRFLEIQFIAPDTTIGDGELESLAEMSPTLAFSFSGGAVVAAPEPEAFMLLTGLGLVARIRQRRRRHIA